jgi:hypothetical protein
MTCQDPGDRGPISTTVGHAWNPLLVAHEDRLGRLLRHNPLYGLTEPVIDHLERGRHGRPPLLDSRAARAERALNDLCRRSHAVGFLDGLPIDYPFLAPPRPLPSEGEMTALGWPPAVCQDIPQLAQRSEGASVRLKGYAGWLLTEPRFLEECRRLDQLWCALPDADRPRFPLWRGQFRPDLPEGHRPTASEAGSAFAREFLVSCERWGLAGMASWDLPHPQGALFTNPLPQGAPAQPRQGLHLFLPIHYPLTGDDDLLGKILREQQVLARQVGLPHSAAGLPHHMAYAKILEVDHWERVLKARFAPKPPRGFIARLEEAIAKALRISVVQVEKYRKAISACRRGMRDQVAILKFKT